MQKTNTTYIPVTFKQEPIKNTPILWLAFPIVRIQDAMNHKLKSLYCIHHAERFLPQSMVVTVSGVRSNRVKLSQDIASQKNTSNTDFKRAINLRQKMLPGE